MIGSPSEFTLTGAHDGEMGYVVGKGPSLKYLTKWHFMSETGPVIAVNEAIHLVQDLGLPNPLYSFQKDGCVLRDNPHPECMDINPFGQKISMVLPNPEVVLIAPARGHSRYCLSAHKNKVYLDFAQEFNIPESEMASVISIYALIAMGCTRIGLVSLDSLDTGDERTLDPVSGAIYLDRRRSSAYKPAHKRILKACNGMITEFITPKGPE